MTVYRCDNCGADVSLADGTGNTHLGKGRVIVELQASLLKELDSQTVAVLPGADNDLHICPGCVFDAVRGGSVTRWNSTLRQWEVEP